MADYKPQTLFLIWLSSIALILTFPNFTETIFNHVAIPSYGQIMYPTENASSTFGHLEIGDQFTFYLDGNIWGSIFEAPEDGFAVSITAYLRQVYGNASRVRYSLYNATYPERLLFVMSTEEVIVPSGFEGWLTCRFTAPPPIKKGVKYWINGWADEYACVKISTRSTPGQYPSAEWTSYMAGEPHGLGYPRFYEVIPQGVRKGVICSIYCTYGYEVSTAFNCPYCNTEFSSYEEVLEHVKSKPTEMIHFAICNECGRPYFLNEELQLHLYEEHMLGLPPEHYSCIFCNFTANTSQEVYTHINYTHQPEY